MNNRVTIKAQSRQLIRTGRVSPLVVSAIVIVIQFVLGEIPSLFESSSLSFYQIIAALEHGNLDAILDAPASTPAETFVSIVVSLINTILLAGYYSYLMGIRQGQEMPYSSLLNGLGIAGRLIWCNILVGIKILLWSLLFFIPGIIASYRYRFATYNLLTYDNLSASQAIALSCAQTEGLKWELFVLDLSFYGWRLLITPTLGIINIWVTPYFTLSDLGFYEQALLRMEEPSNTDEPRRNDTPWEF